MAKDMRFKFGSVLPWYSPDRMPEKMGRGHRHVIP